MSKPCNLCHESMRQTRHRNVVTGAALLVNLCTNCDRRRCKPCGKSEQDVSALACTSCGASYQAS